MTIKTHTFRIHKLVRDKMPEVYAQSNQVPVMRTIEGYELRDALLRKLKEEAKELRVNLEDKSAATDQLVDLQQLLDDIRSEAGITGKELDAAKAKKTARKGKFQTGQFIETLEVRADDKKWMAYYRENPFEYPELIVSPVTTKILYGLIGSIILMTGIVMIPYPGPGWVVVFLGLAVLARQFTWAQRLRVTLRRLYDKGIAWYIRQPLWVRFAAALFTIIVTTTTLWLLNTFALIDSWFGLEYEWLTSPLFR